MKIPNKIDFDDNDNAIINDSKLSNIPKFTVSVLVIIVVSLVAYYWYNHSKNKEERFVAKPIVTFYDLEEININLANNHATEGGNILKLALTLQFANPEDIDFFKIKLPLIRDQLLIFLKEVRLTDLIGSGGTIMIKLELLRRINKILDPIIVKDVLFREFIVT